MTTGFEQNSQIKLSKATALIRQSLRTGNMADAINLLLQTNEKKSGTLLERFAEVQQQYEEKRIGLETWVQAQVQICCIILEADCMAETKISQSITSEARDKILHLLHLRKTEQALTLCEGFDDKYLLLQAQYYAAKKESHIGLLESEYFEATKSRVNDALHTFMGQMEEPAISRGLLNRFWGLFK